MVEYYITPYHAHPCWNWFCTSFTLCCFTHRLYPTLPTILALTQVESNKLQNLIYKQSTSINNIQYRIYCIHGHSSRGQRNTLPSDNVSSAVVQQQMLQDQIFGHVVSNELKLLTIPRLHTPGVVRRTWRCHWEIGVGWCRPLRSFRQNCQRCSDCVMLS